MSYSACSTIRPTPISIIKHASSTYVYRVNVRACDQMESSVKVVALRKAGWLVVWKAAIHGSKLSGLEKEGTDGGATRDGIAS